MVSPNRSVDQRIADELGVAVRQVSAAISLLDGGATVPFIARYRKEATGMLDDAQLRTLPGAGFLIAYDDPVGLARELIAFCG